MKLKELEKHEIEAMSYDDIAFMIITETNKNYKVNELFKHVADIYGLTEDQFVAQIADFFEVISTDQRFIILESGKVDLKTKHTTKVIIEEDEEELLADHIEEIEDEEEEIIESSEEDIFYNVEDQENDDDEDDLQDLMIIEEDEEN